MKILRIALCDGEVALYGERTYQEARKPSQFWGQWNSQLRAHHWHRTELDRDGNPYTVKWYSYAYRDGSGAWSELTTAMDVDGHHPPNTRPAIQRQDLAESLTIPPTQRGRLSVGERLRSPHGSWTVAEWWIADKAGVQGKDRMYGATSVRGDYHMYYLLTHEDGHQEEWAAPNMADADFHRILPSEQQTLT
jgi:hypothetical protein